jgi:uncharacterized circularly permuted ATP-grasp superfamily protein
MFDRSGESPRLTTGRCEYLRKLTPGEFDERRRLADLSFLLQGITFAVYSDGRGTERLFPFDLVPRILPRADWDHIERGLAQRVIALNCFLRDIYGHQRILRDGKIPRALVLSCRHFRREVVGVEVPRGIHVHISGIDLVRDSATGRFMVLEDNARTPSGVSYVLENRLVMVRAFPVLFQSHQVPVNTTRPSCCRSCRRRAPRGGDSRLNLNLLTPGIHNGAYFGAQLPRAQQMGAEGRRGRDWWSTPASSMKVIRDSSSA